MNRKQYYEYADKVNHFIEYYLFVPIVFAAAVKILLTSFKK